MSLKTIHGKLVKTHTKPPASSWGSPPKGVPYQKCSIPEIIPSAKGKYKGLCNRTACQAPGPTWWNVGSHAYYCGICAEMINVDGCRQYNQPDICFKVTVFDLNNNPQFDELAKKDYYAEYEF